MWDLSTQFFCISHVEIYAGNRDSYDLYNIRDNEVKSDDSQIRAFATVTFADSLLVRNIAIIEVSSWAGSLLFRKNPVQW